MIKKTIINQTTIGTGPTSELRLARHIIERIEFLEFALEQSLDKKQLERYRVLWKLIQEDK